MGKPHAVRRAGKFILTYLCARIEIPAMVYQSRRRKYTSAREKLNMSRRIAKIIMTFAGIAIVAYVFFNRVELWDYWRIYFK